MKTAQPQARHTLPPGARLPERNWMERFTKRLYNALLEHGYTTAHEILVDYHAGFDFTRIPCLGDASLQELLAWVKRQPPAAQAEAQEEARIRLGDEAATRAGPWNGTLSRRARNLLVHHGLVSSHQILVKHYSGFNFQNFIGWGEASDRVLRAWVRSQPLAARNTAKAEAQRLLDSV